MPIYAFGAIEPEIDPTAFVHPEAVLIGGVRIGAESSVWPGAVIRGDEGDPITVGARTSIQDGAVLHTVAESPTWVGDECVIGHLVHLEGCTIESGALVGSGAIVLHRAIVRTGGFVAAGAVVLNGAEVPGGALALGIPAKMREGAAPLDEIADGVQHYLDRVKRYRAELRRIG